MNKAFLRICICAVMLIGFIVIISAQEQKKPPEKNFYESSLHYTANGLRYWYSKEQGGLESITGVPIEEVNCTNCHVQSCDACHLKEVDGKPFYSVEAARSEEACRKCHGIGEAQKDEEGKEIPLTDVHFLKGMKCMECHTIREIHGDGTVYNSAAQEGALDAKCENCHKELTSSTSHIVHGGKVDCLACHVLDKPSCHNCHFDTRISEKKSKSFQFNNLQFLVNQKGKVTLATMLTFVYKNQTMIAFGPGFPHDVRKEGRQCADCHNAELLKKVKNNKLVLAAFENGEMKNIEGVIPVLDGFNWNLFWMNWENETWVPIENPPAPIVRYSRYCTPLTQDQLNKMISASKKKK